MQTGQTRLEAQASRPLDMLVFGGSFNPPHLGHLGILKHALACKLARQVVLVPNATSPFKQDQPPMDASHRVRMLQILVQELPGPLKDQISIEEYEIQRPPPSYTIDTLNYLQSTNPTSRIGFMLGADSVAGLRHWHKIEDLLRNFRLIVLQRPDTHPRNQESHNNAPGLADQLDLHYSALGLPHTAGYQILQNVKIPCSSSALRMHIQADQRGWPAQVADCLPLNLIQYIKDHALYFV